MWGLSATWYNQQLDSEDSDLTGNLPALISLS